jgi:hypothetical protein
MQHHDIPSDLHGKHSATADPPAVVIHVRGVHIQIDRLHWPPRWLLTVLMAVAGATAGAWHLLSR